MFFILYNMSTIVQKFKSRNIIKVNGDIHPENLIQKNEQKIEISEIKTPTKNVVKKENIVNKQILDNYNSNMDDIEFIIRQKERHFDNINIKKSNNIFQSSLLNNNNIDNDDNNSEELFLETSKNINQININNDTIELNKITGKNGIPVTINKIDTSEIGNYEVSDDSVPIQLINSISGPKIDETNYHPVKIHNGIICDKIISMKNNFIQLDENIILSKTPIILEEGTTLVTKKDLMGIIEEINTLKIKVELLQGLINNFEKNNINNFETHENSAEN